jgi:hypothetical protein
VATSITPSRLPFSTGWLWRVTGVATPNAASAWPSSSRIGAATAQAPSSVFSQLIFDELPDHIVKAVVYPGPGQ